MLKKIWHHWKRFGQWMGDNVARIVLTIFYFTLALPFGLIVRFTQDPMDVKPKGMPGWVKKDHQEISLVTARRSF